MRVLNDICRSIAGSNVKRSGRMNYHNFLLYSPQSSWCGKILFVLFVCFCYGTREKKKQRKSKTTLSSNNKIEVKRIP